MNNKKTVILILILALVLVFVMTGVSCTIKNNNEGNQPGQEDVNPNPDNKPNNPETNVDEVTITVEGPNQVVLGLFDYNNYKVVIKKSTGEENKVALAKDMLSSEDQAKLLKEGTHTLTINYLDNTTTFNITISQAIYVDIKVEGPNEIIGTFDYNKYKVILTKSNNEKEERKLDKTMLSKEDITLLETEGEHSVKVKVDNVSTNLSVKITFIKLEEIKVEGSSEVIAGTFDFSKYTVTLINNNKEESIINLSKDNISNEDIKKLIIEGNHIITVFVGDIKTEFNITILPAIYVGISVEGPKEILGSFDFAKYSVTLYKSDNTKEVKELASTMLSKEDNELLKTEGKHKINVKIGELETTFDLTITFIKVTSIKVVGANQANKGLFKYEDYKVIEVKNNKEEIEHTLTKDMLSVEDQAKLLIEGEHSLVVTYNKFTTNLNITILPAVNVSISVSGPKEIIGVFDYSQYTVTIIKSDKEKENVVLTKEMVSKDDQEKLLNVGSHEVLVFIGDISCKLNVSIKKVEYIKMEISGPKEVIAGLFNYDDYTVILTKNNGTKESIKLLPSMISTKEEEKLLNEGEQSILVQYSNDLNTTFNIVVKPAIVKEITVTGPSKVNKGEFNYQDYNVLVVKTDNSQKSIKLASSMMSSDDINKTLQVGKHTLTITYEKISTTIEIEILPIYKGMAQQFNVNKAQVEQLSRKHNCTFTVVTNDVNLDILDNFINTNVKVDKRDVVKNELNKLILENGAQYLLINDGESLYFSDMLFYATKDIMLTLAKAKCLFNNINYVDEQINTELENIKNNSTAEIVSNYYINMDGKDTKFTCEEFSAILDLEEQIGEYIYLKGTNSIISYIGEELDIHIPEKATKIKTGAFLGKSLNNVYIHNKVNYIGYKTFEKINKVYVDQDFTRTSNFAPNWQVGSPINWAYTNADGGYLEVENDINYKGIQAILNNKPGALEQLATDNNIDIKLVDITEIDKYKYLINDFVLSYPRQDRAELTYNIEYLLRKGYQLFFVKGAGEAHYDIDFSCLFGDYYQVRLAIEHPDYMMNFNQFIQEYKNQYANSVIDTTHGISYGIYDKTHIKRESYLALLDGLVEDGEFVLYKGTKSLYKYNGNSEIIDLSNKDYEKILDNVFIDNDNIQKFIMPNTLQYVGKNLTKGSGVIIQSPVDSTNWNSNWNTYLTNVRLIVNGNNIDFKVVDNISGLILNNPDFNFGNLYNQKTIIISKYGNRSVLSNYINKELSNIKDEVNKKIEDIFTINPNAEFGMIVTENNSIEPLYNLSFGLDIIYLTETLLPNLPIDIKNIVKNSQLKFNDFCVVPTQDCCHIRILEYFGKTRYVKENGDELCYLIDDSYPENSFLLGGMNRLLSGTLPKNIKYIYSYALYLYGDEILIENSVDKITLYPSISNKCKLYFKDNTANLIEGWDDNIVPSDVVWEYRLDSLSNYLSSKPEFIETIRNEYDKKFYTEKSVEFNNPEIDNLEQTYGLQFIGTNCEYLFLEKKISIDLVYADRNVEECYLKLIALLGYDNNSNYTNYSIFDNYLFPQAGILQASDVYGLIDMAHMKNDINYMRFNNKIVGHNQYMDNVRINIEDFDLTIAHGAFDKCIIFVENNFGTHSLNIEEGGVVGASMFEYAKQQYSHKQVRLYDEALSGKEIFDILQFHYNDPLTYSEYENGYEIYHLIKDNFGHTKRENIFICKNESFPNAQFDIKNFYYCKEETAISLISIYDYPKRDHDLILPTLLGYKLIRAYKPSNQYTVSKDIVCVMPYALENPDFTEISVPRNIIVTSESIVCMSENPENRELRINFGNSIYTPSNFITNVKTYYTYGSNNLTEEEMLQLIKDNPESFAAYPDKSLFRFATISEIKKNYEASIQSQNPSNPPQDINYMYKDFNIVYVGSGKVKFLMYGDKFFSNVLYTDVDVEERYQMIKNDRFEVYPFIYKNLIFTQEPVVRDFASLDIKSNRIENLSLFNLTRVDGDFLYIYDGKEYTNNEVLVQKLNDISEIRIPNTVTHVLLGWANSKQNAKTIYIPNSIVKADEILYGFNNVDVYLDMNTIPCTWGIECLHSNSSRMHWLDGRITKTDKYGIFQQENQIDNNGTLKNILDRASTYRTSPRSYFPCILDYNNTLLFNYYFSYSYAGIKGDNLTGNTAYPQISFIYNKPLTTPQLLWLKDKLILNKIEIALKMIPNELATIDAFGPAIIRVGEGNPEQIIRDIQNEMIVEFGTGSLILQNIIDNIAIDKYVVYDKYIIRNMEPSELMYLSVNILDIADVYVGTKTLNSEAYYVYFKNTTTLIGAINGVGETLYISGGEIKGCKIIVSKNRLYYNDKVRINIPKVEKIVGYMFASDYYSKYGEYSSPSFQLIKYYCFPKTVKYYSKNTFAMIDHDARIYTLAEKSPELIKAFTPLSSKYINTVTFTTYYNGIVGTTFKIDHQGKVS